MKPTMVVVGPDMILLEVIEKFLETTMILSGRIWSSTLLRPPEPLS